MSNKQKLHHIVNPHPPQQQQQQKQLHHDLLDEINKQPSDESDLFDNLEAEQHQTRMVFPSSDTTCLPFISQQQQEEINQHYLNNHIHNNSTQHQTILNPNNFDNLFSSQESEHYRPNNPSHNPTIFAPTSTMQPSHVGLNHHNLNNGLTLDPFTSDNMLTTSTFIQSIFPNNTQGLPSQTIHKPEQQNDFTSFRQMQYFGNLGEIKENSSSYGNSALVNYNHTTSSSFEKREFGTSLTFKENSHLSKPEMMTNDLGYNEQQKDYSFISEGEESNNVSSIKQHQQESNVDALSFSIEDDAVTTCSFSNPILPSTTNNNLFNNTNIQQRSTPQVIQRARSLSMQNPLRRDANQTFSIDGMVNNYMNNTNANLQQQQQHLYSPSSSNSSFASSNNCSPMKQMSSTEVLTNAPIMDNNYQHTSSLHLMNSQPPPTISMDKITQNKAKKTIRSRSFHSRDKMSDGGNTMMLDNIHSYPYFGFNNNNNSNNSSTYSPTSAGSSMEQSPPHSPLATFLSQIDISKLNQEQLAALQVLCMSNQNNLTSPVSNSYSSSTEVTNPQQQQQRRSSVASYMSDDSSTGAPRDSLLKTVLQKQLHSSNEVADENQALYSMIDSALSGCKSSLGLKLVANETSPVNNFPTRSRTFSSPPQFQITPTANITPQEIVSPMSRSSEETVPTIDISNNNTFNFGSFGTEYEQSFENNTTSGVHPRHHSSPAINVNRVEKPTKTKRRSSSVRCNNASASTGQLEQTMVASAVSAVASSSNNSSKKSRRNSISSVEQQPIITKQSKSQNYNKAIVFNNYYDEIQFKKKYGPNSTFYKFK